MREKSIKLEKGESIMKAETITIKHKKISLMMSLAAVLTLLTLVIGMGVLSPQQVSANAGSPIQAIKTKLAGRTYSGGDLESSNPFGKTIVISARTTLYFQWSTVEQNVTAAEWQVTDAPGGFPADPLATPVHIIAKGQVQPIPPAGQSRLFAINFNQILPAAPSNTPKNYYAQVVPQNGAQKLTPSSSVTITYTKPSEGIHFENFEADLNVFANNLKSKLDGKTTGYSYAIYQYETLKKSGAGGYAVLSSVPQSADRRMTNLSMSKTITATAVMKAMEEMKAQGKTISIDSRIAPFLPSDWAQGPHVNEITFKDLLTHISGLRPATNDPDTYEGLRQIIANGSTNANFHKFTYVNGNFCLFRVILPYMVVGKTIIEKSGNIDASTAALYVSYVKAHVLGAVGLSNISIAPSGSQEEIRYYNFKSPQYNYVDQSYADAMRRTGAGYWFMSAKEYGRFLCGLRNGKIVSPSTFKLMEDNNLGMYGVDSTHGRYWDHNGGFPGPNGSGAVADWMIFPNGITAVILINSAGGLTDPPQDIMRAAFNGAW
jgi:CubicO group peptidase (beta-lactamase class C family)